MVFMKWFLRIVLVLILLSGVAYLGYQSLIQDVVVSEARRGTAVNAVPGNVEIGSGIQMDVRSEVEGIVTRVIKPPNSEYRDIQAGDPIVFVDTEEIDLTIEILEADLEESERLLAQESHLVPIIEGLEEELADQEELLAAGKMPANDVERTRRDLRRHRNMLAQDTIRLERLVERNRANLERNLLTRDKMTIRSPIDGTLDAVTVYNGDYIRVNHKVAEVVAPGKRVNVEVSEEDLEGVVPGQPVTVRFLAYGDRLFKGEVGYLALRANADTKRRNLVAYLDINPELLVIGLTGQASIVKGERENALLIPRRALVGDRVYVVRDGQIEVRQVQLGFLSLGQAEILDGLEPGEQVIVETPHIYRAGDRVKIAEVVPF